MLPFVLDLSMLFWNKDLFKEAGLDPEKAPATLAEYATDAKAIQALNRPASTARTRPATAAAAWSSPGSRPSGPPATR